MPCRSSAGATTGGRIATQLADDRSSPRARTGGAQHLGDLEVLGLGPARRRIRKGCAYGKQRCTAYPRYVVQRTLFDEFLAHVLPVFVTLGSATPSP